MCGRFTIRTPAKEVAKAFELDDFPMWEPRYNVAPTQTVPVVRLKEDSSGRELVLLRWGLIPFWAKDKSIGARMINARADTVAEKPAFRAAFKRRRCLVVADGFYEWQKKEKQKQPFHIHMDDNRPFGFAGLWERWKGADDPIESCTIVTTDAAPRIQHLHDRMPVILPPEFFEPWLSGEAGQELLAPYDRDDLTCDPVSTLVNSVKNDTAECVEPIA